MKQPRNITTDSSTSDDVWRELQAAEAGIFDRINGIGQQIRDLNGNFTDDIPDFGEIPPYPEQYNQTKPTRQNNNQQRKNGQQNQHQNQQKGKNQQQQQPVHIPVHNQQRGSTGLPIAVQNAPEVGFAPAQVTLWKIFKSLSISTVVMSIMFGMVIGNPGVLVGLMRFIPLILGGIVGLKTIIIYKTLVKDFHNVFATAYFNIAVEAMVFLIAISLSIYLAPHVYPFLINIGK